MLINRNKMHTGNNGHTRKKRKVNVCYIHIISETHFYTIHSTIEITAIQHYSFGWCIFLFHNNILLWLQLIRAQIFANYHLDVHHMYWQSKVYLILEYTPINVRLQDIFFRIENQFVSYIINRIKNFCIRMFQSIISTYVFNTKC